MPSSCPSTLGVRPGCGARAAALLSACVLLLPTHACTGSDGSVPDVVPAALDGGADAPRVPDTSPWGDGAGARDSGGPLDAAAPDGARPPDGADDSGRAPDGEDAGMDAGADAADSAVDAGADAGVDAGADASADASLACEPLPVVDLGLVCTAAQAELSALEGRRVSLTGVGAGCSVGGSDYVCDWWQELDWPCCPWSAATDWYIAGCISRARLTFSWGGGGEPRPECVLDFQDDWCVSAPVFSALRPQAFVGAFQVTRPTSGYYAYEVGVSADELDLDADGRPDSCDPDRDGDGRPDATDSCPTVPNPDQGRPGSDRAELCNGSDDDCDGETDEGPFSPAWYGCLLGGGCWQWARVDCSDGVPTCDYSGAPGYGGPDDDCDFVDDDCDGEVDEDWWPCPREFPWDNCPDVYNWDQADMDWDHVGDACDPDVDGDGWLNEDDCAPEDRAVHPDAAETCDEVDQDCDGLTDEDCADAP